MEFLEIFKRSFFFNFPFISKFSDYFFLINILEIFEKIKIYEIFDIFGIIDIFRNFRNFINEKFLNIIKCLKFLMNQNI